MCHSAECLHAMQHRPVPQPHGGIIALILQAEAWRGPAQDHTTGKWMVDEGSSESRFVWLQSCP